MHALLLRYTEGRMKLAGMVKGQPKLLMKLLIGNAFQYKRDQVMQIVQKYIRKASQSRLQFMVRAGIA